MICGFKNRRYVLLGERISHSYSQKLHGLFADYAYSVCEIGAERLEDFVKHYPCDGFNVTAPYKEKIIPYLDVLSERARRIGSVNTVVRREGRLYGYNTDYDGFRYLLEKNRIRVKDKKVLVLGSDGASKAVCAVLSDMGAAEIVVVSEDGDDNYQNIDLHDNAHIVVNTTPVGMYPDVERKPVSLGIFKELEAVVDTICNPMRTELMLEAEEMGISAYGGLHMLAYQAKASSEIFTGKRISDISVTRAAVSLEVETENVVLVGMPGCGKSSIARELALFLKRERIDTNTSVEGMVGISIPEIFELYGEGFFRAKEAQIIKDAAFSSGTVIATGGGAILRSENIRELRRNSVVVFLRRETERIATDGRARFEGSGALMKLYRERVPLYLAASDVIVDICETPEETMRAVIKAIYKR